MIVGQRAPPAGAATPATAAPLGRRHVGESRGAFVIPPLPPAIGPWLLLLPALLLVGVLMVLPTLWLVRLSLFEAGGVGDSAARFCLPDTFTWEHYRSVLSDRYFAAVAWSTLRLCLITGVVCLAIAYPLAVWIDRARPTHRAFATWAVGLPKLTNALVLLYGALLLLGNAGPINRALLSVGLIRTPLPMFANLFAVTVGEVLLVLPYPILMLLGVLAASGRALEEAARGLGASPVRAFFETTFRLTMPGAALTLLVTLVWGASAFVAPLVLGNPSLYTISVEIHTQTFERVNWPVAATLAVFQLLVVGTLASAALLLQRLTVPGRTSPPGPLSTPVERGNHRGNGWWTKRPRACGPSLPSPPEWRAGGPRSGRRGEVSPPSVRPLRRAERAWQRVAQTSFNAYAALALLLLLGPLAFSVLVSATPAETIGLPTADTGVSFRWYQALLRDPLWVRALGQSLLTAAIATALAVPVGALAAVAVDRLPPARRRHVSLLLIAPLFAPGVVLGLQALALYYRLGIWGQPYSIGLAHAMWTMPLAFLVVRASLSALDRRLEEAAQGLGAHPAAAFCLVTLPRLWPSLAAAAFLCAIMSLNELPMALFLATPAGRTLPTLIWPQLRYNLTPLVAAASGVLLLLTVGGLLVAAALGSRVRRSSRAGWPIAW